MVEVEVKRSDHDASIARSTASEWAASDHRRHNINQEGTYRQCHQCRCRQRTRPRWEKPRDQSR